MIVDEITEEPGALVERVAALDVGKASLTVCIRVPHEGKPGARCQEVRTYRTLTPALLELRDWLICQGVTLVVMEATSAYWKPPFYLLEDDIACQVVNARDVKNVPGRPKTDLASWTRSGWPSSPSGACCGPRSSRPARSASCGT
jgi:transposase